MARSSGTLTIRITDQGIVSTLKAFKELPADADRELREATLRISEKMAAKLQAAARSDSRQSALIAPTVKAVKGRVPTIQAGGTKRVGRNGVPAYKILFGSEFGSNRLKQYRPHRGAASYWFFKTVDDSQREIVSEWSNAADRIINKWGA